MSRDRVRANPSDAPGRHIGEQEFQGSQNLSAERELQRRVAEEDDIRSPKGPADVFELMEENEAYDRFTDT